MHKKKSKAKRKAAKEKKDEQDEEFWSDEDELEDDMLKDDEADLEGLDLTKLKFTKLKDLEKGMEDVNIEATIDFVGEVRGKEYGDAAFALGFVKQGGTEIKITFWKDDIKEAKQGRKVRIIKCSIGEYMGQLQIYPHKKLGIEFL